MSLRERILSKGPKKLLAIDGGGIRGVLSLEILAAIEALFAKGRHNYVLADDFDYFAGTSTGGIIAAGLAVGKSVAEIMDFYEKSGPTMFEKNALLKRLAYANFRSEPLAEKLRDVFGAETVLGSEKLRSLLLLVMRNATTDSPWPISNNPFAKYNCPGSECNLDLPLWQLVRASTAAPTYFPPEAIEIGGHVYLFVDGGVTVYNNPAFQMVLMATLDCYWPLAPQGKRGWTTGEKDMLVVSIGTGATPIADDALRAGDMTLLYNASHVPGALMNAAQAEQDLLCRAFGKCLVGDPIDLEVGDMIGATGLVAEKRFTYLRYNTELTKKALTDLGCGNIDPARVSDLAAVSAIGDLRAVGRAVAAKKVKASHFDGFLA